MAEWSCPDVDAELHQGASVEFQAEALVGSLPVDQRDWACYGQVRATQEASGTLLANLTCSRQPHLGAHVWWAVLEAEDSEGVPAPYAYFDVEVEKVSNNGYDAWPVGTKKRILQGRLRVDEEVTTTSYAAATAAAAASEDYYLRCLTESSSIVDIGINANGRIDIYDESGVAYEITNSPDAEPRSGGMFPVYDESGLVVYLPYTYA